MNITITASDGKEFKGTNYDELVKEVGEYEVYLKKQEEERQTRFAKADAESKTRENNKKILLAEIKKDYTKLVEGMQKYEKDFGGKIYYILTPEWVFYLR